MIILLRQERGHYCAFSGVVAEDIVITIVINKKLKKMINCFRHLSSKNTKLSLVAACEM